MLLRNGVIIIRHLHDIGGGKMNIIFQMVLVSLGMAIIFLGIVCGTAYLYYHHRENKGLDEFIKYLDEANRPWRH